MKGYKIFRNNSPYTDGRIWKTKTKAKNHIKHIIKNNSLAQRRQTMFINLKVKVVTLNQREEKEMKQAKDFIYS